MLSVINNVQKSIFGRLLFIFSITAASILLVLFLSLKMATKDGDSRRTRFASLFSDHANYLINDIGTPPNISKATNIANSLHIQIMITGNEFLWKSSDTFVSPDNIEVIHRHHREDIKFSMGRYKGERFFIIKKDGYTYYLTGLRSFIKEDGYLWFWVALTLCFTILYFSYRAINWLFAPLKLIQYGAQTIEKGGLSFRLHSDRNDEIGNITHAVNSMATELEKMLEAKRQLLLAISHELRTPITRAKVGIEFIDNHKIKQSLSDDLSELDRLIGELLESERLNQKHNVLSLHDIDITQLIRTAVSATTDKNNQIEVINHEPYSHIKGDPLRLELLIKNLIGNGLKYGDDKPFVITNTRQEHDITIEFKDQGSGIEEEHLQHITEPFYRADSARQRQTGGYGLGLYLCKLIAEAHKGKLDIVSTIGEGTTVTVTLPINQ
ncbi:hypothetical protein A9Q99_15970 [Gammaproteobacteria bacterium 45_16_T64]|nr:hypothetical protein A9Q99_15970 [Gammaproteobacteria bacterium 45_16_T64]